MNQQSVIRTIKPVLNAHSGAIQIRAPFKKRHWIASLTLATTKINRNDKDISVVASVSEAIQ